MKLLGHELGLKIAIKGISKCLKKKLSDHREKRIHDILWDYDLD